MTPNCFTGLLGKLARGSQKARAVICPDAGLEVFGEKFALDSCQILNEWIKKISWKKKLIKRWQVATETTAFWTKY